MRIDGAKLALLIPRLLSISTVRSPQRLAPFGDFSTRVATAGTIWRGPSAPSRSTAADC